MEPEGRHDDDSHPEPAAKHLRRTGGSSSTSGIRLGISVGVGLGVGLLLDNWLGTRPIFTLIGMVVGIGAAMYTIWDVARDAMRR